MWNVAYDNNGHDKCKTGSREVLKIEPEAVTLRIITTGEVPAAVVYRLVQFLIIDQ